jgi:DNA-binding CsgD family transcriptional regulator
MPRSAVTKREIAERQIAIRAPGFVGRERELAELERAVSGGPAVILVEGEAGIGKTRLVREFLATAVGQRSRALVATCPPFLEPHTLGPVVDAVRQAAGDVRGLHLSELAGALRPVFPEWAPVLPPLPAPLEDATASRHRVFRALAEVLARLDVGLLVLEDAQWADEATLEFGLFLASSHPPPLSLVLTFRPEDVSDGSLLRRLSRLAAGSTGLRLALGPLDVEQAGRLVSSMLSDEHVSTEFATFLHEHTDGLPLALEESVRLMRDRRDLARQGGEWVRHALGDVGVPPSVRDAVLERMARLGSDAQAVLQAAAVLADPAGEPVLRGVSGLPDDEAASGLSDALVCGLLAETSRPNGQPLISFRHALACRAVYEAIPAPQRRRAHLRAGQALEDQTPPALAQLARHFREAGDTARWCRYAEQAADLALAVGDPAAAAALLRDLICDDSLPAGAVVRLMWKIQLMPQDAPGEFVRALRRALDGDGLTAEQRVEARFQLGRVLMDAEEFEAGAAELARAIPGMTHRPVQAARAMLWLGWPSRTPWPAQVNRRWLARAAATVVSIPEAERLKFIGDRATALLMLGDQAGWAVADTLPSEATRREAPQVARGCVNIADAAMRWGRYGEARHRLTAALALTRRYQYPRVRDAARVTLAHLDWFTGAWESLAGRAEALAGIEDVDPLSRLEAVLVTGLLAAAAGDGESAERKLRLVLDVEPSGVADLPLEPSAALARLRLLEGRAAEAVALTDGPIRVMADKKIWLWATEVAPVRTQALAATGRSGEAAQLADDFARGLRGRDAPAPHAAVLTCRAVLAESRAEHGRAAVLFGRAASAWQALPRPYDGLLARERQGRCLLAAGRHEAGLALLSEAYHGLADLGAAGDAGRVASGLREHGVETRRVWRGGRRGYGDQLSPRELEVVRLVIAGHTNRQIAEAISRSPHTVHMQVNSAMRKLNVTSRTALAVSAIEAGVVAADE